MKALIHLPYNCRMGVVQEAEAFSSRLTLRGYTAEMKYAPDIHEPRVYLDDEAYDYETLREQSYLWMPLTKVQFQLLSPTAKLPTRGSLDAAGLDLYADIPEPLTLTPGKVVFVPTGVAVQCPSGTYAQIFERSGLGSKGISTRGGVVDRDYRGEVKVMLQFISDDPLDKFTINVGDRVAQIVFLNYLDVQAVEATSLSPTTRDGRGWGSSGR